MSKYHPNALRNMAMHVREAWLQDDPRFNEFLHKLKVRIGWSRRDIMNAVIDLAGY